MKTLFSLIIVTGMFFISCGDKQSKEKDNKVLETTEQLTKTDKFKKFKDCDEFLEQYEKWMDNYLIIIEKYMKNLMDAALAQ